MNNNQNPLSPLSDILIGLKCMFTVVFLISSSQNLESEKKKMLFFKLNEDASLLGNYLQWPKGFK